MKFKCIVVLYNVNYEDSVSYIDLLQTDCYRQGKMEIICVDNSEQDYGNQSLAFLDNHTYISMGGNKGLSKAYNAAIDYLNKEYEEADSLIVLLDDDTHINNEYFEKMEEAFDSNYDIYFAIVLDEQGILSPGIMKRHRCRRCTNIAQLNNENISGINSGMGIKESVFKKYHYNEEMFLDYIDHYFVRDMKLMKKKIKTVNTYIHQDFSSLTDTYEKTINRFRIFKRDIKVYCAGNIIDKVICIYIILRRKISIVLKFKKISALWKC